MLKAVCAWASRWCIVHPQQISDTPVTVERELRCLRDTFLPKEKMNAVLVSASVISC